MSLPLINATPQYELTIPSTGQVVTYRPYLVKEEKVLLIAFESKDTKATIQAMMDVISSCVTQDIDVHSLATFDLEYMFLQIRSKSVGETATVNAPCSACGEYTEIGIPLDEVIVDTEKFQDNIINLTDEFSVEMRYLTYSDAINSNIASDGDMDVEGMIRIIARCIKTILTPSQRIDVSEYSVEDINAFVDQLTSEQFQKLTKFYKDAPSLKYSHEFKCDSCGHDNKLNLTGLSDFFG
jgi:hypothetical protein